MAEPLPIVFACSGCSPAGQLANRLALELDQRGAAQMSCLAGVGAARRHFLKQLDGRPVWIIDGCPIQCGQGIFEQVRERYDVHIRLQQFGVKKHAPPPEAESFDDLVNQVLQYTEHSGAPDLPSVDA